MRIEQINLLTLKDPIKWRLIISMTVEGWCAKPLFREIKNGRACHLTQAELFLLYNEENIPVSWNFIVDFIWGTKEIWLYTKHKYKRQGYQKYLLSKVAPMYPDRNHGSDWFIYQQKTFAYYDKFSQPSNS